MRKAFVSLLILFSVLLQGFSALACHHDGGEKMDHEMSSCHQEQESHKALSPALSQESEDTNCLMCATGSCFTETSVMVASGQDFLREITDQLKHVVLPLAWASFKRVQNKIHVLRPPPQRPRLPQSQNWQAFYSVYLN